MRSLCALRSLSAINRAACLLVSAASVAVDAGYGVHPVSLAVRKPGYTLGQFMETEYFCVDGEGKRVPSAIADRLTAAVVAASCYRAPELNDAKSEAKAPPQQPERARSEVWLASAALSCVSGSCLLVLVQRRVGPKQRQRRSRSRSPGVGSCWSVVFSTHLRVSHLQRDAAIRLCCARALARGRASPRHELWGRG